MQHDRPWQWTFSIAILFLGLCLSFYTVFLAVESVRNRYAENFAHLGLLLLGIPAFLFQASILLFLTGWCVREVKYFAPTIRVAWLLCLAILLPGVTLGAVILGHRFAVN